MRAFLYICVFRLCSKNIFWASSLGVFVSLRLEINSVP